MRIRLFYHSMVSDWNNGNAHFLRGITAELLARGHQVRVFEPLDGWSLRNLREQHGEEAIKEFSIRFPHLQSIFYSTESFNPHIFLSDADLVLVHEWNDPKVVRRIGRYRRENPHFKLFFHDTHHRALTTPQVIRDYGLSGFDGVLAYGRVLRDLYVSRKLTRSAWTWHEAADIRTFRHLESEEKEGDLVWIGNWGDEERTEEYKEFLIDPVRELGIRARAYGVRYPASATEMLDAGGIEYCGWLPNYRVPEVYSRFHLTIHIPRRPYVESLPGIPTIRPFEALACGIPMVCSPWQDAEGLFTPGKDFLVAKDGAEMKRHIKDLLDSPAKRRSLSLRGQKTIASRHTCGHRVSQLLGICRESAAGPVDVQTGVSAGR